MNRILKIVDDDKDVVREMKEALDEIDGYNYETTVAIAKQATMNEVKLRNGFKLAGKWMVRDQKEIESNLKEVKYLKEELGYKDKVVKAYKDKHGEIDTTALEKRKLVVLSDDVEDPDEEVALRYINRQLERNGLPKTSKIYTKR